VKYVPSGDQRMNFAFGQFFFFVTSSRGSPWSVALMTW